MVEQAFNGLMDLIGRGGPVMWPLVGLSVLAGGLLFERGWFFLCANRPRRRARVEEASSLLRAGETARARDLLAGDRGPYGRLLRDLLREPASEAAARESLERQRLRLERFLPTLSTIITAAPMLGILGTVLGIIASFDLLAEQAAVRDPKMVSQGIAEALITTAAGLVIAVATLFPYGAVRAQVERTLGRLESLAAAILEANLRTAEKEE
ncbi:MAG: MotA/TolQ/ExbB proton channel family protein [Phycisphaeraceae bacterium]